MANSEDIKLIIEAQDKASKQLDTITKSLGGFVDKAESSADTLANLGKAAAGYFAFDKVKDFLVSSVSEFAKAEQSAKLMEAVLKQTGNTTGMTAAQILAYADSIEQATGIEAESLQAAATQLARNAKLTGDQFKDLLRLGTDMSVVLGGDIASNSLILAKALESPENAVAKLAKVFIFFTEEQKKQIATMLEAGDVAKAYSVIIGEIDRQVGGVAEKMGNTTAGRLKKLENAYGNFKEGIGGMSAGGIVNTTDKLNSVGNYLNGSDPSKLLEDASKFQIAIETKMRSVTDIQEDARKQIEASNKKELELLAAATQIQSEIDGSNLWTGGNGSIFGIKVGEDVDELTVKLKKLHDEVSRIRGERWAFEGSGLGRGI